MNDLNTLLTPTSNSAPITPAVEEITEITATLPLAAIAQDSGEVTFFDYDSSQQYPAPDGKRLVTCTYRNAKGLDASKIRANQACFVPSWITADMIEDNASRLLPFFTAYLLEKEDSMVKDSHKTHSTLLGASKFGIESMLDYLEASQPAGRLNSTDINAWFMAEMQEAITSLYIDKVGTAKIGAVVEFINKKFQSLASPKTIWNDAEMDKLLPILEACNDDAMASRLIARVKGMTNNDAVDILDSL